MPVASLSRSSFEHHVCRGNLVSPLMMQIWGGAIQTSKCLSKYFLFGLVTA